MHPTNVKQKIFELRGIKFMLDFHLAELYGVPTKRLNEQVKRNRGHFPKDFMFRLSTKEWEYLSKQIAADLINKTSKENWSQFATSLEKHRGKKYLPYGFTEHGVVMVANVLKTRKAVKMSVNVVRAFVELKKLVSGSRGFQQQLKDLRDELYERIGEHDTQLKAIYDAIENLLDERVKEKAWQSRPRIGFQPTPSRNHSKTS